MASIFARTKRSTSFAGHAAPRTGGTAGSRTGMNDQNCFAFAKSYELVTAGALVAAPGVWTLHLLTSYALVPPSCEADTVAPLHLTTAAALLIGGGVTWWSVRTWRRLAPGGGPTAVLALVVAALAIYFTVVIAMVGLTPVFQSPCQ